MKGMLDTNNINRIKGIGGKVLSRIFPAIPIKGVIFLNYHRINDDNDFLGMAISPRQFCDQVEFLIERHSLISFDTVMELLKRRGVDRLYFAMTFDDGYRDNSFAFDYLKGVRIKPALFISVDAIEGREMFWFDTLRLAWKDPETFCRFFGKNSVSKALQYLKSVPSGERIIRITEYSKSLGIDVVNQPTNEMFSWDMLKKYTSENTVVMGSHGLAHESLRFLNNNEILRQLRLSREVIEERLNVKAESYAFPNGSFEDIPDHSDDLLRRSGYGNAFSLIPGLNNRTSFRMGRVCITKSFSGSSDDFNEDIFLFNIFVRLLRFFQ